MTCDIRKLYCSSPLHTRQLRTCFLVLVVAMCVILYIWAYHQVGLRSPCTCLKESEVRNTRADAARMVTWPAKCNETHNIAFLKIHKAASSTVVNILQRFGETRKLTFVLPRKRNYIGKGVTIPRGDDVLPPPAGKHYNLLVHHVVYNGTRFREVMPPDTVYIGIVREPFERFVSSIEFYKRKKIPGPDRVSTFFSNLTRYENAPANRSHTNNRMAFDFGVSADDFHNRSAVLDYVAKLDKELFFVILVEQFDESLILLRRNLCWTTKDILYIKNNVNDKKTRVLYDKLDRDAFRKWTPADVIIYEHFRKEFWRRMRTQPDDFFQEVLLFKQIVSEVQTFCFTSQTEDEISFEASYFSDRFSVSLEDCVMMMYGEGQFLKITRQRHLQELRES